MHKRKKKLLTEDKNNELTKYCELLMYDYCDFKLQTLARKIKMAYYRPKLSSNNADFAIT